MSTSPFFVSLLAFQVILVLLLVLMQPFVELLPSFFARSFVELLHSFLDLLFLLLLLLLPSFLQVRPPFLIDVILRSFLDRLLLLLRLLSSLLLSSFSLHFAYSCASLTLCYL